MELQKEIDLINDIVLNAVVHGADCGGAYNQNEDGLRHSLNEWLKAKGIQDDYYIDEVEREYYRGLWCVLQIEELI